MKNKMKRIGALFLVFCILVSTINPSYAQNPDIVKGFIVDGTNDIVLLFNENISVNTGSVLNNEIMFAVSGDNPQPLADSGGNATLNENILNINFAGGIPEANSYMITIPESVVKNSSNELNLALGITFPGAFAKDISYQDNDNSVGLDGTDITINWTPVGAGEVNEQDVYIVKSSLSILGNFENLSPVASFGDSTTNTVTGEVSWMDSEGFAFETGEEYKIYIASKIADWPYLNALSSPITVTLEEDVLIPSDTNSLIESINTDNAGTKEAQINIVVKDSSNQGIADLVASDFSVQIDGGTALTFENQPFSDFMMEDVGLYSVIFTGQEFEQSVTLTNLKVKDIMIHATETFQTPYDDGSNTIDAGSSGITNVDDTLDGSMEVTLTIEVQNSIGGGIEGLLASDFSVEIDGENAVTFENSKFSDFQEIDLGVYSITFTGTLFNQDVSFANLKARGVMIHALESFQTPAPPVLDCTYDNVADGIKITDYTGSGGFVYIPDTKDAYDIVEIAAHAFENKNITKVFISDNVQIIGEYAFAENQITEFKLPADINLLPEGMFKNNSLEAVDLSGYSSLKDFGGKVFYNNSITDLSLPSLLETFGGEDFRQNQIAQVEIPQGITDTGYATFKDNNISSISFNSNLTSIGDLAFYGNSFENLEIPNSVSSIGNGAFGVNSIMNLKLNEGLQTIGLNAFASNELTSIALPATLNSLGSESFINNNIAQVNFKGTIAESNFGSGVFETNNEILKSLYLDSGIGRYIKDPQNGWEKAPDYSAKLEGILINGQPISNFSPEQMAYNVVVPYGQIPVITAEKGQMGQTVSISPSVITSLPATVSIAVTSEDPEIGLIYILYISEEAPPLSLDNTLKNIYINGELINGFSPYINSYNFDSCKTTLPLIEAEANHEKASITIEMPNSVPGVANIYVTAENGSIRIYSINLKLLPPYELESLNVNGELIDGFMPSIHQYEISVIEGNNLDITAVSDEPNAVIEIQKPEGLAGEYIIKVHDGNDGRLCIYKINVSVINRYSLSSISVNNVLLDDFSPFKTEYSVEIPENEEVNINCTLNEQDGVAAIEKPDGNFGIYKIVVNKEDGTLKRIYTIDVKKSIIPKLHISNIYINGEAIDFDKDVFEYSIDYSVNKSLPVVTADGDGLAEINISNANQIPGNAKVIVSNGNNETIYLIKFNAKYDNNAKLKSVLIDGKVYAGFNVDKHRYQFEIKGDRVPKVEGICESEYSSIEYIYARTIPGITIVKVIAQDLETVEFYRFEFIEEEKEEDNSNPSNGGEDKDDNQDDKEDELNKEQIEKRVEKVNDLLEKEELSEEAKKALEQLEENLSDLNDENKEEFSKGLELLLEETEKKQDPVLDDKVKDQMGNLLTDVLDNNNRKKLDESNLEEKEDGSLKAKISEEDIFRQSDSSDDLLDELTGELDEQKKKELEELTKKNLRFEVPDEMKEQDEVEMELPSNISDILEQNKIDNMFLDLGNVQYGLNQEVLEGLDDENVSMNVKEVKNVQMILPGQTEPIAEFPVLELEVFEGDDEVAQFNRPMDVSIPVGDLLEQGYTEEEIQNEFTVVIIDEATGEAKPVGGWYNPATGCIEFKRIHLSKYTVLKTKKAISAADNSWAKKEINALLGKGVIEDEKNFEPEQNLSREEFASWVSNAYGLDMDNVVVAFTDVDVTNPYYKDIAAAYQQGLLNGKGDGTFDPKGEISREEMAVLLARVLEQYEGTGETTTTAYLGQYQDAGGVSDWAADGVSQVTKQGLFSGNEAGEFDPKASITKEQAAAVLYRMYTQG